MGGWGCTTGRSGPDCTVGPRSGPGPNCAVGPRSGPDCAVGPGSGPDCAVGPRSVNCTKLASPSFAIDALAIRMLRKTGVEL